MNTPIDTAYAEQARAAALCALRREYGILQVEERLPSGGLLISYRPFHIESGARLETAARWSDADELITAACLRRLDETPPTITDDRGGRYVYDSTRADGRIIYRRGRSIISFDAWQMEQIRGAGLRCDYGAPGKRVNTVVYRAEVAR